MTFFTNTNFKKAAVLIGFLTSSANAEAANAEAVNPPRVDLGTAANYALLTKTGVTTTGVTAVTGDIGTSPIAATALTGFGLVMDPTTTYSESSLVTGKLYAADYTTPTSSDLTTAISNMQAAYSNAAGRPTDDANPQNLLAGLINDETLTRGVHKWDSSVSFSTLKFDGSADDIWILQISGDVDVENAGIITLSGGAKAENIFWQIAGSTSIGTTAHVEGVFLCATFIAFRTGSTLNGAALAQTAVTLDATTIVRKSKKSI